MTIYVRVSRIAIKSVFPPDKTYVIAVGSLPRGQARTSIAIVKNSDLTSQAVWSLARDDTQDDKIWMGLFQQNSFSGETKLASLVIPIEWLPLDRVVKVSFPLRLVGDDWSRALPTLVKLHYSTNSGPRFRAPPGQLTVQPAWGLKQPKVKKAPEAEAPPPPPPPTMVMIPRPVYEHMRALQQQVTELRLQLAQRQAAEQAGGPNVDDQNAQPIERQPEIADDAVAPPDLAENDVSIPPIERQAGVSEAVDPPDPPENDVRIPVIEGTDPTFVAVAAPIVVQAQDDRDVPPIERQAVVAEDAANRQSPAEESNQAGSADTVPTRQSGAPPKKKRARAGRKATAAKKAPPEDLPAKAKNSKK
jgi:hypothetical protein